MTFIEYGILVCMGKETLVMVLGVWVALQTLLGFPLWVDRLLYALLGLCVALLGFVLYREHVKRAGRHADTFVEHTPEDGRLQAGAVTGISNPE